MSKPSVFFAALLRGPAAKKLDQMLAASKLLKKPGSLGWPANNRHQSLSDLQTHPIDLPRLLKVGATVRCAPVVLRFDRIEGRGRDGVTHWELKPEKSPALDRLLDAIRLSLVQQGLSEGGRITPYITLSYRAPYRLEQPVLLAKPIEWRIDQFQLLRSTGHGPTYHYEELGRWTLDGKPEPEVSQLIPL